jgi:hypothetical protein
VRPIKRPIVKVYGWEEQNECSFGIKDFTVTEEADIKPEDIDEETGEITCSHGLPEGQWFVLFRDAKRAAIEYWKHQKMVASHAITRIQKTKLMGDEILWGD